MSDDPWDFSKPFVIAPSATAKQHDWVKVHERGRPRYLVCTGCGFRSATKSPDRVLTDHFMQEGIRKMAREKMKVRLPPPYFDEDCDRTRELTAMAVLET